MPQTDMLVSLFHRNLPYITREENTVLALLSSPENAVFTRENGHAACVVHKNNILLLAVDEEYRGRGIGSELLAEAEAHIRAKGYDSCTIGAGDDYLCPGVPVREKPFAETLLRENLDPRIPAGNATFFIKRGYAHAWGDCNCFDMRMNMADSSITEHNLGDTILGVVYRWAELSDMPAVLACTDDAQPSFTQYYSTPALYDDHSPQRVLIALADNNVVGAVQVCFETEGEGLGSVGCTAVSHAHRGKKIATNMIMLGVKELSKAGMRESYLGYTYSGLDKLYGLAGHAVSVLYFMAHKDLTGLNLTLRERTQEHVRTYFTAAQADPLVQKYLPAKAKTLDEALADYAISCTPAATSFGRTIYAGESYVGDIWAYCVDPTAPDSEPQAMVSYCIFDPAARNRGIATRALSLFLQGLQLKFGLSRVGAFTYLENAASIRVLEKNGFTLHETPEPGSGYYANF